MGILRNMKTMLAKTAYDEAKVWDALVQNQNYLKKAYQLFDRKFNPFVKQHNIKDRMDKLKQEITRNIGVEIDRNIFS